MQDDDDTRPLTEAERISQTRFGARPIPQGHRESRIDASDDYRRIPPHGDVSPDGRQVWPRPSTAAKLLVWGGTAAAAVAVTAGTALALRRIGDALAGDKPAGGKPEPRRRPPSQRPARPPMQGFAEDIEPEYERRRPRPDRDVAERSRAESIRARMHDDEFGPRRNSDDAPRRPYRDDDEYASRRRPRRRKPRNLIAEFEDNSRRVTHSVDGLFGSLGTAMTGFLSVARQAGTIMREFGDAADLVRAVMDNARKAPPEDKPGRPADSTRPDPDRRSHNL